MTDTPTTRGTTSTEAEDFRPLDAEAFGIQPRKRWFLALLLLGAATLVGQIAGLGKVLPVALDEGRLAIIDRQLADRRQSLAATESEYEESQKKLLTLTPQVQKATLTLETAEKDGLTARKQRDDLLVEVNTLAKRKDAAEGELAAITAADRTLKQCQQELAQTRKDLEAAETATALIESTKQKKDAELKDLMQKVEAAAAEVQKLEAKLATMRADASRLEGKQTEEARIDAEIATKTKTLDEVTKNTTNAEAVLKDQSTTYYRQKNETEALRASVTTLTVDKRALEQDYANLKGQLAGLNKQLADLNTTIGQKTKERDALTSAVEETTTSRDALQRAREALQEEVTALAQEKSRLSVEVESVKSETIPSKTSEPKSAPSSEPQTPTEAPISREEVAPKPETPEAKPANAPSK